MKKVRKEMPEKFISTDLLKELASDRIQTYIVAISRSKYAKKKWVLKQAVNLNNFHMIELKELFSASGRPNTSFDINWIVDEYNVYYFDNLEEFLKFISISPEEVIEIIKK